MAASTDEEDEVEGVLYQLMVSDPATMLSPPVNVHLLTLSQENARKPLDIATSKPAQRAYISTALFVLAALLLLGVAATTYIVFYFSYIPNRGFALPVYLQFDPAHVNHPHGTVQLGSQLVSVQPYDVHVILDLPRSRSNQDAGNFMIDLQLLPPSTGTVGAALSEAVLGDAAPQALAHSRRPAMLTYHSYVVEHAHSAFHILSYVINWRREAEVLKVDMMEGIEFSRGWRNVPTVARLELHSDTKLQVYDAKLVFTARFQGLRYLMYNYRIICFVAFTSAFWTVEVGSAVLGWILLSQFVFASKDSKVAKSEPLPGPNVSAIKKEGEDEDPITEGLSDTSRTFPTFSRQPPLRYSSPKAKEDPDTKPNLNDLPLAGVEADDEDEDADFVLDEAAPMRGIHSDSGLGTSLESSAGRHETVRRRKSGGIGSAE